MKNEDIWFDEITKWDILFENDRIKHSSESKGHLNKKKSLALRLLDDNYTVGLEVGTKYGYVVDVVGCKGEENIAIEVGTTKKNKLEELEDIFTDVRHIGYTDNEGNEVKRLSGGSVAGCSYIYIIPRLSEKPAYSLPKDKDLVYTSKISNDRLAVLTHTCVGHFHRKSVNVGYEKLERECADDVELIDSDISSFIDKYKV